MSQKKRSLIICVYYRIYLVETWCSFSSPLRILIRCRFPFPYLFKPNGNKKRICTANICKILHPLQKKYISFTFFTPNLIARIIQNNLYKYSQIQVKNFSNKTSQKNIIFCIIVWMRWAVGWKKSKEWSEWSTKIRSHNCHSTMFNVENDCTWSHVRRELSQRVT